MAWRGTGETSQLTDLATISLFRISQEALTNVARHAKANEVSVSLSADARDYQLRSHDDGVGFPKDAAQRPDALGLLGMREWVLQLGGTLSTDSVPGNGVTITAKLPLSRIAVERGA